MKKIDYILFWLISEIIRIRKFRGNKTISAYLTCSSQYCLPYTQNTLPSRSHQTPTRAALFITFWKVFYFSLRLFLPWIREKLLQDCPKLTLNTFMDLSPTPLGTPAWFLVLFNYFLRISLYIFNVEFHDNFFAMPALLTQIEMLQPAK